MRKAIVLLTALFLAGGCHAGKKPELRVLGVHDAIAHEVVFVQVSNPAKQAMRLTKLTYKFAAAGGTVASGEMPLRRDVPAGAAVVVEVPLDVRSKQPMTLHGELTAELDQVERTFPVEAQVNADQAATLETPVGEEHAPQEPAEPHADETLPVEGTSSAQPSLDQGQEQPLQDSAESSVPQN